jgi:carotenoid cleavage dioxygenase-like enzyme
MSKILHGLGALCYAVAHGPLHEHGDLPMASGVNLGFEPVPLNQSFHGVPLKVNGTVPDYLKGTLYRGAPGAWPDGWWLDGLITLNAFKFESGKVFFTMAWNEDEAYNHSAHGTPLSPILDVAPYPGAIPHNATASFPTGVAFREIDGHLVCSTGVSNVNRIDPKTLAPVEMPFAFEDDFARGVFLAPTHAVMTEDGHLLHHLTTGVQKGSGGTPGYIVTDVAPGTRSRKVLATIEHPKAASWSGKPSFMHQTMATLEYYIMLESVCYYPETVTPVGQVNWAGWESNLFATAHVRLVNRATGESLLYPLAYNVCGIHHVTAYKDPKDPNLIHFDTIQLFPSWIPCAAAFRGTAMSVITSGWAGVGYKMSKLLRITVPLDKPGTKLEPKVISPKLSGIEFPTIRPDRVGKYYTYLYSAWISSIGEPFYDALVKVNSQTGEYIQWKADGHYPGEPIFVKNPDGEAEDGGVVMTNVLDTKNKQTYLLLLDAETFEEIARVGPTPSLFPMASMGITLMMPQRPL